MIYQGGYEVENLPEVRRILEEGFVVPESIGFEFDGIWIQNPFYDETFRFELDDPVAYYGKENVEGFIGRLLDAFGRTGKTMNVDETLSEAVDRSVVSRMDDGQRQRDKEGFDK